jgi:hypothetical protein
MRRIVAASGRSIASRSFPGRAIPGSSCLGGGCVCGRAPGPTALQCRWNRSGRDVGARHSLHWADGVLDWELTPDNTNSLPLIQGGIGPYGAGNASLYRCPADRVVSSLQAGSGWNRRVRSDAMNAMMGNAGEASSAGVIGRVSRA